MPFETTFTFSSKLAFRKQIKNELVLFGNLRPLAKYPENREVEAQTPPVKDLTVHYFLLQNSPKFA